MSEDYTKYKMKEKHLLGPDKDGNVFTEEWERELGIIAPLIFKDLADPLVHNKKYPWMDRDAVFEWKVKTSTTLGGVTTESWTVTPFPAVGDATYEQASREKDKFYDKQKRFDEKASQIISFLLNGTMTESTRARLLRVLSKNGSNVLAKVRETNDILLLKSYMVGIHDYGGLEVDDKDKKKVEKKFVDLQESKFGPGYTVADHSRVFEELVRQLRTFKLIGNANTNDDRFKQTDLFDAFTKPMETHDNSRVRQHLQNIDEGVIVVDKTDPEAIYREFAIVSKLEKKAAEEKPSGKKSTGSNVLTVNGKEESGKVNSAVGNVRKTLRTKIEGMEKERNGGKLFVDKDKQPKTFEKIQKIKKEKGCSFIDAAQEIECWNCHKKGHLSVECPDSANGKEGSKKKHSESGKEKKSKKVRFKAGKKTKTRKANVAHGEESSSSEDEESSSDDSYSSDSADYLFCAVCNGEESDNSISEEDGFVIVKSPGESQRCTDSSKDIPMSKLATASPVVSPSLPNPETCYLGIVAEDVNSVSSSSTFKDISSKIRKSGEDPCEGSKTEDNFTPKILLEDSDVTGSDQDSLPGLCQNPDLSSDDEIHEWIIEKPTTRPLVDLMSTWDGDEWFDQQRKIGRAEEWIKRQFQVQEEEGYEDLPGITAYSDSSDDEGVEDQVSSMPELAPSNPIDIRAFAAREMWRRDRTDTPSLISNSDSSDSDDDEGLQMSRRSQFLFECEQSFERRVRSGLVQCADGESKDNDSESNERRPITDEERLASRLEDAALSSESEAESEDTYTRIWRNQRPIPGETDEEYDARARETTEEVRRVQDFFSESARSIPEPSWASWIQVDREDGIAEEKKSSPVEDSKSSESDKDQEDPPVPPAEVPPPLSEQESPLEPALSISTGKMCSSMKTTICQYWSGIRRSEKPKSQSTSCPICSTGVSILFQEHFETGSTSMVL